VFRSRAVLLLLGLLLILPAPAASAAAPSVQVVVDGRVVLFDQPPRNVGGRVLVPLRGVFERLGAFVQWEPRARTVIAGRPGTQVVLVIGNPRAAVNGRPVSLDVPPLIIGGRTLVPLRFVSQALGARVEWEALTRTVFIFSIVARPPAVVLLEGTVARVEARALPPQIFVQRGGVTHMFVVTAETAITQVDVETNRRESIDLLEIRRGDLVRVTADAARRAMLIRVSVREVTGRVDFLTSQTIVLADGRAYALADEARFLLDGHEVSRRQVQEGMEVTLRVNPQTQDVIEVRARRVVRLPVPVRIVSLTHNALQPLRAGEILTVTLRGTPGGVATFDVFGVVWGAEMREVAPGLYRGAYTVRSGENAVNAPVVGHLRVGLREAPIVRAEPVTIDTLPPLVTKRSPEANSTAAGARPNIVIQFTDRGGSGIDPDAIRLFVEEDDVTDRAIITETSVAFIPRAPLSGRVTVRLVLRDRAGNRTEDRYTFTVPAQAPVISSVTVHPSTPLRTGDVVTVTLIGEPRGQAVFTIEGVVAAVRMAELGNQPGVYVGTYTIRQSDPGRTARVIVQLARGDRVSQAEAPVRLTIVAGSPQPEARIVFLAHDAQKPLRGGEVLTVTLRGTPGGVATFDVSGVVTGAAMREVAPGVYQGAYAVRAGDNVVNGGVFGHLRIGAREAPVMQAATRVTLDTLPPVVTRRSPEPNSAVSSARPEIIVTFVDRGGSGIDPDATRLFVEDDSVTDRATVTDTMVAFTPRQALSGRVSVRLVLLDRAGNRTEDRYSFTVTLPPSPLISTVTVHPATPVRAGDVVTVTMAGEPRGQAVFTIEGVVQAVPMAEASHQPGVYVGTYTIRPADPAGSARVSVQLARGDRVSRAEATAKLTIVASGVAPPAITVPAPGAQVGVPLVIRGTAPPGFQVVVRVVYRMLGPGGSQRGTYGEVTVTADRAGNWQVIISPSTRLPGAELTITARAVDAAGRSSEPAVVIVTQR